MSKVDSFPVSSWQRTKNRRGRRALNCIVSDRYLIFGEVDQPLQIGSPVFVDVMTEVDQDKKPRKLCSLCLTLEDLKNMVKILES